jgi:DNA-binding transcriptional MerR regulator
MRDQDQKEDVQLSTAKCAARTGLTVRALRVYEREGLLQPPRSASGWRCYGRYELIRINTICVLKEAGLTLAQMREILQQQGLQLEAHLTAQIEGWRAKQEQAERGRILANAALLRVRAGNGLSIDQLCALVQSIDASSTDPAMRPLVLRLLDIPLEQRAEVIRTRNEEWNPRWLQDYQEALRTRLDPDLERLMDAGVPPFSPEAQRLVDLQLQVMAQFRVREEVISWFSKAQAPNPCGVGGASDLLLRKGVARHVLANLKQRPTELSDIISHQWTPNPFLAPYFAQAESESAQCKGIDALLREAQRLSRSGTDGSETKRRALADEFQQICRTYGLGEPRTYAEWAALARPPPPGMTETEDRVIWNALADAVRVHSHDV